MPILINELEVVVEAPAEEQSPNGRPDPNPLVDRPQLGPIELSHLMERRNEIELRLFAH